MSSDRSNVEQALANARAAGHEWREWPIDQFKAGYIVGLQRRARQFRILAAWFGVLAVGFAVDTLHAFGVF